MTMHRWLLALAGVGVLSAQSGIGPPLAGYVRDDLGNLRPLYGVFCNFVVGEPIARRGLAAADRVERIGKDLFRVQLADRTLAVRVGEDQLEICALTGFIDPQETGTLLAGLAVGPDPPRPRIVIEPQALRGGQQAKVAVPLVSPSQTAATGELTMGFTAGVAGKSDDSGVLFPATGTRKIAFTVAVGETVARFGSRTDTEFQTGTTAGSIVFTAKLGAYTEQLTAVVPSGYVVIDNARSARVAGGVEVEVTGFDTSRSTSLLSFTFYSLTGGVVAPGTMQVDASGAFRQYFETTELGSMFKLRAVFPVTGDISQIGAVEAILSNSLGSTQTRRLQIP